MTVAVLLVALLSMVSFVSAVSPVMADSAPTGFPTAGDTIRINSEADLIAAKAAYGWNGTGTASNPIVIDGTKGDSHIDMAGSAVGLYIANITTLNIQIKNWTINNTANDGIGIQILNVRTAFAIHGVVVNNTKVGINLNLTRSAEVYDCVLFDCETGVLVERSSSPVVRDNNMYFTGLTLATTKAVHFFRSLNGAINNNEITDIKNPILIEYCVAISVGHNNVLNCTLGLFNNQGSANTFIHNNTFENVGIRGVHLNFDSNNATLVDNVFKNCTFDGVFLTDDNDAIVKDNEFNNCTLGIGGNTDNRRMTIYHNVFIDCDKGIDLNETTIGTITYNAFLGSSSYGVSLQYNAIQMSVHHNVFKDCNAGGVQAFDFVDDQNQWNDSSFGNYWNDHIAPGIHDTGVSDTPYLLAGGGQVDSFPLTYPIGPVGNLGAVAGAGPKILLNWGASNYSAGAPLSSPESHYIAYRTGGGDPEKKWTLNIGINSLIDTTVSAGSTYTYSVYGNNTFGNSGNRSVSISTSAANVPVVNITSPAGATIFATATIPVTWEGWGNGSAVTKYEIRLDTGIWIDKGLSTTHTFIGVSEGSHLITVKVTNAAINTGFDAVSIMVDTVAPTLTITSPIEGYKDGTGTITVAWIGSDASSGIKNYSLRVDGGAWKNENLATSDTVTGLQNGTHSFEVRAFDNAGNSVIKKVNATVDRAAPVVAFIVPTDGLFTKSVNFTARWSITDATGVNTSWARLINTTGSALAWLNVTGKSAIWITNLTQNKALLINGAWQMVIAANDTLGNNGTTICHFTVDTVSPTVEIVKPASGSFNNTGLVTVRWNATDINLEYIEYRLGTGSWINVNLNNSQELSLTDGTYIVQVRATDKAGNNATASVTIHVDTVPPVISNVTPASGSFMNEDMPTFTWDVTETGSGMNQTMVSLDGVDAYIGLAKTYTATIALNQGQHTFNITVWDNATNMNSTSIVFYVDLTSPVVVILNPVEGGYYNVTSVIAAWLGVDPTPSSGIAYYESQLDSEGWQFMGATTVRPLTLTEGVHTFSVRAFDNASNSYTTSVSFVVDLTAPLLAIDSPSEGAMFASMDVTITWTGYDDLSGIQSYSVRVDGQNWTDITGVNMSYVFTGLSDGVHTASVRAMDNAGNYVIMDVSFTTDVTSPYVVIIGPAEGAQFSVDSVFVEWTAAFDR